MQRGVIYIVGMLALSVLLTACFRDASQGRDDPTTIPIDQFLSSPTGDADDAEPTETGIPTLTSTPEGEPSSTLPIGGPPTGDDEEDDEDATEPAAADDDDATLPPTRAIPSFTPRPPGTFGDSGLTPTQSLPEPPLPDALITPTAFEDQGVAECIYLVEAGDTLFSIATTLEVEVDAMISANPALAANPNSLQIGDLLSIPGCVPEGVTLTPAPTTDESGVDPNATAVPQPSGEGGTHIVQEGETLFRIALQYNTSVDALVAANPALTSASTIIQPGQELIIPGQ